MGLKLISEQYRNAVLNLNLQTPPDIVLGLVDLSGAALYAAYLDALGKDAVVHSTSVINPGDVSTDAIIPRHKNLVKNLQTPNDITQGVTDLTDNQTLTAQYFSGLGLEAGVHDYNVINPGNVYTDGIVPRQKNLAKNLQTPADISANIPAPYLFGLEDNTVINDYNVVDPGNVDTVGNSQRQKLFGRNKPHNINDPSENDPQYSYLSMGGYTYTSLIASLGQLIVLNDYPIPNANSVSLVSNQTSETSLALSLQLNRYTPNNTETYEVNTLPLLKTQSGIQYINSFGYGINNFIQPDTYVPSQFLNIKTSIAPISMLATNGTDTIVSLLNNGTPPLPNETLLMNIAAIELKYNFESRIKNAIEKETKGRTAIDEALTNPLTALNIIKDPLNTWFEKNYEITVSSNPIGKGAEFIASLAGIQSPISLIRDIREDYSPKCFGNATNYDTKEKGSVGRFINDLLGKTASRDRDVFYLNHTGTGQKYCLFSTIAKNKYTPDYLADYDSGVFQAGEKFAQAIRSVTGWAGIGAGKRPEGFYYIGNKSKSEDPFYLLQDADGDQINSNEELTQSLIKSNATSHYDEPGYDQVSETGSIETNFIWKSKFGVDTILNPKERRSEQVNVINKIADVSKISYNKNLRECSILYKTSQLLEKGLNGKNSPIDQTLTKFYDGYDFVSKGNATITPTVIPRYDKDNNIIGNRYLVPGLDASGKRTEDAMYYEAELCRTWTKTKPYAKIGNLIRHKELARRERNSVLERNGNLNIFPTELNVNTGYGRIGTGMGDASVEAFGEKRARKYMFSLENLAWRDSQKFAELPSCEKGSNGGRIMWFPPYDISFTDDTQANWSTHQFLGRPEPIYTYNNSERSGTLSWKIVVDHPSILNVLTQKELAKLTDGEVDEILTAFWAGCIDFDIFDLARIWNQFSQSDISYFKKVIGDLDLTKPNPTIRKQGVQAEISVDTTAVKSDINDKVPTSVLNYNYSLFFENDVPLNPTVFTKNDSYQPYRTGTVEPFNIYFEKYKSLVTDFSINNVEEAKDNAIEAKNWMKYQYTLGKKGDNIFSPRFDGSYNIVKNEISNPIFNNFDLEINLKAYASPLAPSNGSQAYNDSLAGRRMKSVIKWIIELLRSNKNNVYTTSGEEIITNDNIEALFTNDKNKIIVKRGVSKEKLYTITFNQIAIAGITSGKIFKDNDETNVVQGVYNKTNGYPYYPFNGPKEGTNDLAPYYCFQTQAIAEKVKTSQLLGDEVEDYQIGAIEDPTAHRGYTDIVCGALSLISSYERRVEISLKATVKNPEPIIPKTPPAITPPPDIIIESPSTYKNVTKREIAQRILNKLTTECDYFEYLQENSPIVYNSLKEKLRYFSPAFHSMTPEGLNARLTFLQQCMRPGETIKRSDSDTCNASNTAFGKPPICVLRIGDFYNTKIVINSLNISYDPLIWDLNSEGIGVQPMIANISLSFKYIGGSGLRKYVDELQNALSFNYYGTADVYDDRTFANNDLYERNLINLEKSFFDGNRLDLIPIVFNAEKINPENLVGDLPYGTIGKATKRRLPTTAGGEYGYSIFTSSTYTTQVYDTYSVVNYNSKFYVRKPDDVNNITSGNTITADPTDTKYWEEVIWRNYGEQAFMLEFGGNNPNITDEFLTKTYFNSYEIQYMDLYKELYKTYGELVASNFNLNKAYNDNSILLNLVLNKNYNKILGGTHLTLLDDLSNLTTQDNFITVGISGSTKYSLYNTFDNEAIKRNYVEFGNISNIINGANKNLANENIFPLRLHLYPQNYLYKIGDGKAITGGTYNSNVRFNPGNFTGGNKNMVQAEVSGIFLKDFKNPSLNIPLFITSFAEEFKARVKLNLPHFWFYAGTTVYQNYLSYFETPHQTIFTEYICKKFDDYLTELYLHYDNILSDAQEITSKFGVLLAGVSVISEGYDMDPTATQAEYFEVIPNDIKLNSDVASLFGYDPYFEYKHGSIADYIPLEIISLEQCYSEIYNSEDSYEEKLDFLSLGNGTYFFKQLSKNSRIETMSGTNYTIDNYLSESLALSGATVNPNTQNFIPHNLLLNGDYNQDGTVGITTIDSISPNIYTGYYPMTYTYEKMNYEVFDFGNKVLDVMLNDNFISKEFDLDISYDITKDFKTQLNDLFISKYYSSNNNALSAIPISYYTFNTISVAGTNSDQLLSDINTFIKYDIDISKVFSSYLSTYLVHMSGLLDFIFVDFFTTLTDADKAEILRQIKLIEPYIPAPYTDKEKKTRIDSKFKSMESTLNSIFALIKGYTEAVVKLSTPIGTNYTTNYNKVLKAVNKIITGTESETKITGDLVANALIRGNVSDYTLALKDCENIPDSVINNQNIFTSYKELTNIVNEYEVPIINEEKITTELSKYI